MRIQQFVFGNVSFKTEGDLYKDKIDDILTEVMTAIRTTIIESFRNIKAQARISKNKDNINTIYFAVRYEDVDKDKNVYDIIKNTLDTACKKIYDKEVEKATTPLPPPAPGDPAPEPYTIPTGSISGKLVASQAIIKYTPETLWSNMIEDPMCEINEAVNTTYNVDEKGVCSMNNNLGALVYSKSKMETIRKTVDVLCNYWMDAPETVSEYTTMNLNIHIIDWKKSFTKKDIEHPEWCSNKYIAQLKELKCDYDDVWNVELIINDDYNASTSSITAVLRVPGAISDYGLQRRIEDVRKARQSVKIKDQTEDNKYRMLDLDIDLGDGRTLELRTNTNAPSMSKFFYKK